MRCGRISVEGEADEIAVSSRTRYRQRHGKRLNPYSTGGLEKFKSVHAELSAKREHIAKETGAPESMVRFVYSSKNGWIPIVLGARDREIGRKKNGGDAAEVSTMGPAENDNGEKDEELRRKDEGNYINGESEKNSFTSSAPTNPVRAHGDPTRLWATAKDEKFRTVSMDNWHTPPEQESDNFYRRTRSAGANDGSVRATVMTMILLCLVFFYGRFFAILFTCACLYLLSMFPMLRESSERMKGMKNKNNDRRKVDLQSSKYTKKFRHGLIYSKH